MNGDGSFEIGMSNCSGTFRLELEGNTTLDAYLLEATANTGFVDGLERDAFGGYLGTVGSPATSRRAITVGAFYNRPNSDTTDPSFRDLGKIAYFSSRGPTRDGRLKPELVAGGMYVLMPTVGNRYILEAGTSFSSPVVAGLVALMLERNPNLTPEQVKESLTSNAVRESFMGGLPNNTYGYGKAVFVGAVNTGSPVQESLKSAGGGGGCNTGAGQFLWAYAFVFVLLLFRRFGK